MTVRPFGYGEFHVGCPNVKLTRWWIERVSLKCFFLMPLFLFYFISFPSCGLGAIYHLTCRARRGEVDKALRFRAGQTPDTNSVARNRGPIIDHWVVRGRL